MVRLRLRVGAESESGGWMSPEAPSGVLTSHTLPTLKGPSEALTEEGEHAIVHGGAMIAQLARWCRAASATRAARGTSSSGQLLQ